MDWDFSGGINLQVRISAGVRILAEEDIFSVEEEICKFGGIWAG